MANTVRNAFPLLEVAQAQKETTHNEALRIMDILNNMLIKDRTLATPPGSPANGDTYLVAASATGVWAGQDGKIAFFYDGWSFITAYEGMQGYVDNEERQIIFSDGFWRELPGSWAAGISASSSADQVNLFAVDVGSIKPVNTGTDGAIVVLPQLSTIDPRSMLSVKKTNSDDNSTLVIHGFPLNLLTFSNDQSNAAWAKTFTTISTNVGLDPTGATTLDKIQEDNTTNLHEIAQVYAKPFGITRLVASFVVQAVERNTVMLMIDQGGSANRAEMRVALSTNTVSNTASAGNATYVSGTCTDLPNSNKLITIVVDVTAAAHNWSVRLRLFNGASTYLGVTGQGVFAGRAQLGFYAPLPSYTDTTTTNAIETIDGSTTREIRTQGGALTVFRGTTEWAIDRPESDVDSGTWTPSVSGSTTSGTQTYGTRVGHWTRRGRWIDFICSVNVSTLDAATAGNLRITGLPFAAFNVAGLHQPVAINIRSNMTLTAGYTMFSAYMTNNSAIINLAQMGSNVAQALLQATAAASGLTIDIQGTIRTN